MKDFFNHNVELCGLQVPSLFIIHFVADVSPFCFSFLGSWPRQ